MQDDAYARLIQNASDASKTTDDMPALLGMLWGSARSNIASAVLRRCGGACTGGCGRPGRLFAGNAFFFAGLCNFS